MFSLHTFVPKKIPVFRAAASARQASRSARAILDDDETPVDLSEDNDAVNGVRPWTHRRSPPLTPTPAAWHAHRKALKEDFPEGWNPPRKLSRDAMDGLRQLNRVDPETFTTPVLAERFRISPEAVRRILKSHWEPPRARRMQLLRREAEEKAAHRGLARLRERIEAQQVLQSKHDMQAARHEDYNSSQDNAVRGISSRDRLTFE